MVTFLAGGTGTPKVLAGAASIFPPAETTVVANNGDDVALGGVLVCPDIDTMLFLDGGVLDRETWWGIDDDSGTTHEELQRITEATDLDAGPRYRSPERQTDGPRITHWRRFSGVGEFMYIGDRDRAVHITRSELLSDGHSLTEVTGTLCEAFDVERTLLPMSDDPVATIIRTPEGPMHFQEWWVHHNGEPEVRDVTFRGAETATPTNDVYAALDAPVVIGPSNPVTSIGPMLAMDGFAAALESTPVVAVSPFVEDTVFSGPAATLMAAIDREPSTAGVVESYPFADAFVLDEADDTDVDRPVVRTNTAIDSPADGERVAAAVEQALAEVC